MEKFAAVSAVVATLEANYANRLARVEAAFKVENSDITPTLDNNGRYHAPCDGYQLPLGYADMCEIGHIDQDKLYATGEYLPEPVFDEEHAYNRAAKIGNLPVYKRKVKAPVVVIAELIAADIYRLQATQGREWPEAGVLVAYAYLEGMKSLVDAACIDLEATYNNTKVIEPEIYLEGKQVVTGEIVMVKIDHDNPYQTVTKMMVKTAEGHKLFGTMPKALPFESKGKFVSFSATFKPGKNGLTYYSRPTQAELIEAP